MISMITNRSDLYERLWNDYSQLPSDQKHDSFLYQYLKAKKDAQAERVAESAETLDEYSARKKRDKYVLLRSAYLAYKNGLVTEEEYISRFKELAGAKGSQKYEPFTPDLMSKAQHTYENEFIIGCISDFFYNMGYRTRKSKEDTDDIGFTKIAERYIKEKDGYIDDLDLWARYYIFSLKNETDPPAFTTALTDEYISKCNDLITVLDREERSNVFVPLYYDAVSGAGVIVIGNDLLPKNKQTDRSCRICIMYFSELLDEMSEHSELSITMISELYDDVGEAFEEFKKGIVDHIFTENYGSQNYELPDGVDSIFANYFWERIQEAPSVSRKIAAFNREERNKFNEWLPERNKHLAHMGKV